MLIAELRHLFRRTRVRALLIVMFAIPFLLAVAVKINGGPSDGNGPTFLAQVSQNGVFAALAGLTVTIPFFLPLTVAVVSGDTIAGEASIGTLRYLLTRPSGRGRLLGVKAVTTLAYCLAAALAVAAGGLIGGAILFPLGRIISLSGTSLPLIDGIGRTLLAALVVGASLLGLAAIGVFVSTLTDVPVGAMAVTAGIGVLSLILDAVPQVAFVHPWLFTHQQLAFGDLLRTPVRWNNIGKDLLLQLGYVAVFGTAAWARFTTRDVLA
ncbi:ABC transporter permease [Acidiferrimicrobium sp. IK]|uniref:ABC transporter permease n=1 Tax=Acidiferrimicrobium sp. IK TaxID=2871700 RepID=UPI0021CAED69|nr:ABC transporter permease [Acidiferrimicrobium sp. IK]MCU4186956.1 ABC transporter permease [Acidiferrimicrobium sp. IK]